VSGLSMDQLGALGQSRPTYSTVRTRNPVSEWLRANLPFLHAERSYMTRRFRDVTLSEARKAEARRRRDAGRARQSVADAAIRKRLLNRKLIARAEARRRSPWAMEIARAEAATKRDLARALARSRRPRRRKPRVVPPTPRGVQPARTWVAAPQAVAAASQREFAQALARSRRPATQARPTTQQARQATMARSGATTGRGMPAAVISYFQF
jgi:hypothetical protein